MGMGSLCRQEQACLGDSRVQEKPVKPQIRVLTLKHARTSSGALQFTPFTLFRLLKMMSVQLMVPSSTVML